MMVYESEEAPKNRIDPCSVCGGRIIRCCVLYVENGFMVDVRKSRECPQNCERFCL